jgi:pimeloyl-ACP methyl ester carboxylesterase
MHRRAVGAVLAGVASVALACAGAPGVHTDEAATIATAPPPSTASPQSTSSPDDRADDAAWRACPGIEDVELSLEWECRWVDVPLEHNRLAGPTVQVAITRPQLAPGDRRRPLVLNPGGPGDPGTSFAWWFVDLLPMSLLEEYYPVGWDPRGVGLSDPAIDCGPVDPTTLPLAADCIARTGALLAHVGAADAALDLEEVRVALGVERLDYLGFSYGTALGAVYAMARPTHVGHVVLDGAIAPDAGDPTGPLADHTPDYAADELAAVIARFHELCAATAECAAGPDSAGLVAQLATTIDTLPTDDFAGQPEQLTSFDIDEVLEGVSYDPYSYGLLADALREAAEGDASTLAALIGYVVNEPFPSLPPIDADAVNAASFAIHCADFSDVPDVWGCEGMPPAADLPVIGPVDVARPILVIGTRYDPATPGRHATELAHAFGDAVAVTWEGVGHTAFPAGGCLDDVVVGYFRDGAVPADGSTCPFIDGAANDAETAEWLFRYDPAWVAPALAYVLEDEGETPDQAECESRSLAASPHRIVTHLFLDVTSDGATSARQAATAAC